MRTCNAWLSGGPLSIWYGITVVKYCKQRYSNEIFQIYTYEFDVLKQPPITLDSWSDLCCGKGLVPFCIWFLFLVTWCCLRRFCTANNNEINWFFNSFSYSSSSRNASSAMRVSLRAPTKDSISPSNSVSWLEVSCFSSRTNDHDSRLWSPFWCCLLVRICLWKYTFLVQRRAQNFSAPLQCLVAIQ